ncbi:MAG: N-acetylmuramic acid 6-phosphate etherase [Sulfitobacter sp.]
MSLPFTESIADHLPIDALPAEAAAGLLLDGQMAGIRAAHDMIPQLTAAAKVMADSIQSGGSLVYAAAGSSGLMALSDASELHGTFGIPHAQIQVHMAGGVPTDGHMPGDTEDGVKDVDKIVLSNRDVAIVASASGSTPYALAVAARARQFGATVVGLANNAATPLLAASDFAIYLPTPPEVIAGSTRMAAGAAQKAALNVMSSLMGVALGHVYKGMMVNLVVENAKLRARATGIICKAAGVTEPVAASALKAADGRVKAAILVATGHSAAQAQALLDENGGYLDRCLT